MTDSTPLSSRQLGSGQVRSLLSLGLSTPHEPSPEAERTPSLEDVLNSDPDLLKQAFEDLACPCPVDGPFSIYRLTGTDRDSCPGVEGHSWLKLLSSRKTDARTRDCLRLVGQILRQSALNDASRMAGSVIEMLTQCDGAPDERLSSFIET